MSSKFCGTIRLSGREAMYLMNAEFLPVDLMRIVNSAKGGEDNGIIISVTPEISDSFRESFTERLAEVGFDDAYEPTSEGKILEELIDIFYVE
ncbi:MAG: hypothetical protein LBV29_01635 [Azoarcus sp.]|jgi:hypothetical protein|nr:hypothetical protein [Azoarcus sp.]